MEEQKNKESIFKKPKVQSAIGIFLVFVLLGGFIFWKSNHGTIFIENSVLDAPVINLGSTSAGTLNALYVKEGDVIGSNAPVASVGTDTISSKQNGIVINVSNNIGSYFSPGQSVVSMIHKEDMRVVGTIDENKGLSNIAVGQNATFSVDAFPSKTYVGIVDSISQTSDDTGIVFSISDKRPIKKFSIKVRFDVTKYPELKNGMSAKITIYE